MTAKRRVRERRVQTRLAGHARPLRQLCATWSIRPRRPRLRSRRCSPFWAVPPQPKAFPDMPSDPSLQPEDGVAMFGQPVVSPPAPHILLPGVPQLVTGSALTAPPLLPYFRFESLQTFRSRFNLQFAVQAKSQEFSFPDPPYPALGRRSPVAADASRSIPEPTPSPAPPPVDCLRRCCSHPRTG